MPPVVHKGTKMRSCAGYPALTVPGYFHAVLDFEPAYYYKKQRWQRKTVIFDDEA